MGSGQINEFDGAAANNQRTNMTFNRDARIVADALFQAGQSIE